MAAQVRRWAEARNIVKTTVPGDAFKVEAERDPQKGDQDATQGG